MGPSRCTLLGLLFVAVCARKSSPEGVGGGGVGGSPATGPTGGPTGGPSGGPGATTGTGAGGGSLVLYGQPYDGGQYNLGPVDYAETQWHNACAPGTKYNPQVQSTEGVLLAG